VSDGLEFEAHFLRFLMLVSALVVAALVGYAFGWKHGKQAKIDEGW